MNSNDLLMTETIDNSYKVWTTPRRALSVPIAAPQAQPELSQKEKTGVASLRALSTGTPQVTPSVYGAPYILAYEPRAKGVPLLMLEGFSSEPLMTTRVKEVRYHKGSIVGAYNVSRQASMRVKILGGVVSYFTSPLSVSSKVSTIPAKAGKSPEALMRWAEAEAKKAKKNLVSRKK